MKDNNLDKKKMKYSEKIKVSINNFGKKIKNLLIETPIEIFVGAGLGLILATGITYNIESKRETKIPLGFSEISQIERDIATKGKGVGPWTRYLTSVNDMTMKVFECWNDAHKRTIIGDYKEKFASELEERMDPTGKFHHYEIMNFVKSIPKDADKALMNIKDFIEIRNELINVNSLFDNSWEDSHIDSYHTSCSEVCTTDSDGDSSCHEECHQVYDYTTHSYDYNTSYGEKSSKSLDELIYSHPNLQFKENIMTTSKTNAEGEYAADVSRDLQEGKTRLDEKELLSVANTWYNGSTLKSNIPKIIDKWKNLNDDSNSWREAKNTAKSTSYITYSSSDSGPQEFQIAEKTLDDGQKIYKIIDEIVQGVKYTKSQVPILESNIKDFIAVMKDNKQGDADKLSKNIMKISKEIYKTNFKNGFEVDRLRLEVLLLAGLFGGVVGGLAGYGADKIAYKQKIYERLFNKNYKYPKGYKEDK